MIHIRTMTIDDLQLGLKLVKQARWNQTESDWLRFMNLEPDGCFVVELDGHSVGTATTCVFGKVAWIAMLLVDINARGKGAGTKLLKHCLDYLQERKVKTIRLDATPLGRAIYEKLGFIPEYELARYEGIAPRGTAVPDVAKVISGDFAEIIEFDNQMTGTDRGKMLTQLFTEYPDDIRILRHGNQMQGFITIRPGANAIQIGPCAATANAGPALLSDALDRHAGEPVFVDIPLKNADAVKLARSSGLKIQRCFTRMYRGEKVKDTIKALWAGSGPEKG